jgi:hypothetical protein
VNVNTNIDHSFLGYHESEENIFGESTKKIENDEFYRNNKKNKDKKKLKKVNKKNGNESK